MTAHSPIIFGRRLARICSLIIGAAVRWPVKIHRNRQILHSLHPMSESELADIGLCRQDLSDSTALPLTSEIGAFLAARVSERRRSRG